MKYLDCDEVIVMLENTMFSGHLKSLGSFFLASTCPLALFPPPGTRFAFAAVVRTNRPTPEPSFKVEQFIFSAVPRHYRATQARVSRVDVLPHESQCGKQWKYGGAYCGLCRENLCQDSLGGI